MNNREIIVASLMTEWESIQRQLEPLFRARDMKNTSQWMEKGINLFLQLLYLTNDEPFVSHNQITLNHFPFKPVNLEERLGFIKSRPGLYHSYRQLSELMLEQQKQFVIRNLVKKSSRN